MVRGGADPAGQGGEDKRVGWIELDGAVNVRDLGGLPAEDGRRVAEHRLLRGDNLQDLSPADVRRLVADIGLTTVIDLRSLAEVAAEGPGPLTMVGSLRHAHHPILPEYGAATDAVAALAVRRAGAVSRYPEDVTCGYYLGYLEDRPDQVVAALRGVAAASGAVLVHCAAGKDRTGVVVALALTAAGVRREAVVADYAASGERTDAILARLRTSPTYAADVSRPAREQQPRAETMSAFLDQVHLRYGGVRPWLAGDGFGPDDVTLLKARLLEA
jgi:protein-tyrosine phosphatase